MPINLTNASNLYFHLPHLWYSYHVRQRTSAGVPYKNMLYILKVKGYSMPLTFKITDRY